MGAIVTTIGTNIEIQQKDQEGKLKYHINKLNMLNANGDMRIIWVEVKKMSSKHTHARNRRT